MISAVKWVNKQSLTYKIIYAGDKRQELTIYDDLSFGGCTRLPAVFKSSKKEILKSPRNRDVEPDTKTTEIHWTPPPPHFLEECPNSYGSNHRIYKTTHYTKKTFNRVHIIVISLEVCHPGAARSASSLIHGWSDALRSWWPNSMFKLFLTWAANCLRSIWWISTTRR